MQRMGEDFLAVISNGISGSYARNKDKAKAMSDVARIYKRDFREYIKFPKGKEIVINVVDVTGHDEVWWDDHGFHVGKKPLGRVIEKVKHVY